MKGKASRKTWAGWAVAVAFAVVLGLGCWLLQVVPTSVGPIVTALGWVVSEVMRRVGG